MTAFVEAFGLLARTESEVGWLVVVFVVVLSKIHSKFVKFQDFVAKLIESWIQELGILFKKL